MSDPNSNPDRRILYLEHIKIVTTKTDYRVNVKIDNRDVVMRHEEPAAIWTPNESLEFPDNSTITVAIKTGHTYKGVSFRKQEARVEVTSEEAVKSFWDSIDSASSKDTILRSSKLGQYIVEVTFKLRPSKTSEDTRTAVIALQKEMEKFRAIMADTTERHVDNALKVGVVLAELDPMSKLTLGLAKFIFDVLKEQRKYDEMASDLASAVDRIFPFTRRALEEEVPEGDMDLLRGVINRLYELIGDIAAFICSYVKRGRAFHTLKSTVLPEDNFKVKSLQDKFSQMEKDFDRAVGVETLALVRKIEMDNLLKLLKPIDEANYQEEQGCMEGTRTAVLDRVITWVNKPLDSDQSSKSHSDNVYWLYGMPGLGKTSVANSLCHRLRKSENLGGSFFCKRDNETLGDPKNMLPTLISKLAAMWAPYGTHVAKVMHDDPNLNPKSTSGELLLKTLGALKKPPPRMLVLVIDAFDECGEYTTRKPLLKSLFEACSQVTWLKVIITSRPEHDIQSFFETHACTNDDLAEDDHTGEDILYFAQERMQELAENRKRQQGWPGEARIGQITQRSHGLFIYIDTIYRILRPFKNLDEKLDLILGEEQQSGNSELHNLYLAALKSQVGPETEEFCRVARAIIAAATYRPLNDETLSSLIGKVLSVAQTWVDALGWVFLRERSLGGGIRVRHLSILEFLTGLRDPAELRVDLKQAHEDLSFYCLNTMIKGLKFNICGLETSCLPNCDIENLDDRVRRSISDALQYSCLHWASHLCADLDPPSEAVSELLVEFFTGKCPLYWLEALSLIGNVPMAVVALQTITESTKKLEGDIRLRVEDVLRFVHTFSTPISTSAPHIYVSALPFIPLESNLWTNVHESFPNILNVCTGRLKRWPGPARIWQGHHEVVRKIAYSPNGLFIVSGSPDGTIRIWDTKTGAQVDKKLDGHTSQICDVSYSPNGQHIISAFLDQTIRIWNAETGAAVGEPLTGHTAGVQTIAYSPDGQYIVSGSYDETIRIWNAEMGTAVGEPLSGHTDCVYSITYSPDGKHIISGSHDKTIRIWDAKTGAPMGEPVHGHTDVVNSVVCSPDGKYIVSGSHDETIRIWDAKTGAPVHEPVRGHTDAVDTVAYSPDGKYIVSGSWDDTIRLWDAETGAEVGEPVRGHTSCVCSVTYSPNGKYIASSSHDKTIRIWDAETGAAVGEALSGHTDWVYSVACSPDGKHIASGSEDRTIRVWDAETGAPLGEPLKGHTRGVDSVTYSPEGKYIASGSWGEAIQIWGATTEVAVNEPLSGDVKALSNVVYSPDGKHIAYGVSGGMVRIWDVKTGAAENEPLKGHTDGIYSVAYSPNGKHIVSGSYDTTIRIWDVNTGAPLREPVRGHTAGVKGVAYSPDGKYITSGSDDTTVRIWDAETGSPVGEPLRGHTRSVSSVAYSPDGNYIVSGSSDGTIRFWNADTGAGVGEPVRGHTDVVNSAIYSPDGNYIISGSRDQTIRIWDARRNESDIISSSQFLPTHSGDPEPSNLSHQSLPALPSAFGIANSLLDSDGWVRCADGLLLWIPEDCRNGLTSSALVTMPTNGHHRRVRVDFTRFRYGTTWTTTFGHH